jgi:hypothetical protein
MIRREQIVEGLIKIVGDDQVVKERDYRNQE